MREKELRWYGNAREKKWFKRWKGEKKGKKGGNFRETAIYLIKKRGIRKKDFLKGRRTRKAHIGKKKKIKKIKKIKK